MVVLLLLMLQLHFEELKKNKIKFASPLNDCRLDKLVWEQVNSEQFGSALIWF